MSYHLKAFLAIFITLIGPSNTFAKEQVSINKILKAEISSSINPATLSYLQEAHEHALKENYDAILITMNTPGGLVSTTKEILTLMGKSDIPFIIWISPEGASATSAGAIIASGAHTLLMSEGTNIGAATPIQMGKDIDKESDMRKKAVNDIVSLVKSLAQTRNRNALYFEKMVSEAKSYTAKEALKNKAIDGIVNTQGELVRFLNQRIVHIKGQNKTMQTSSLTTIDVFEMDLGQKLLNIFANPSFAYILFLVGAALIYLEFQTPGGMIAGALGACCLILAAIGFQVLPLNIGALGLMVLSFVLFVMEAFITSYGILTLAGIGCLVTGSLFLFRTNDAYLHLSHGLIFSAVAAIVSFIGVLVFIILKDQKNVGSKSFNDPMQGDVEVLKLLTSSEGQFTYQVKGHGEIWQAISKQEYSIGQRVKVIRKNNLTLEI